MCENFIPNPNGLENNNQNQDNTNIVQFVNYIPFTKEEMLRTLECEIKNILDIIETKAGDRGFLLDNTNLACYLCKGHYIIFNKNADPTLRKNFNYEDILNQFNYIGDSSDLLICPNEQNLDVITKFYDQTNPYFVTDKEGKTVISLKNTSWVSEDWSDSIKAFPVFIRELTDICNMKQLLAFLVNHKLIPLIYFEDDLTRDKIDLVLRYSDYITTTKPENIDDTEYKLDIEKIEHLSENDKKYIYNILFDQMGISNPENVDDIKKYLLESEKKRCSMEAYNPTIINGRDVNSGLWNFWSEEHNTEYDYILPGHNEFTARNPNIDIMNGKVVGIDFGTSSTVVVVEDKSGQCKAISLGKAEFMENPTFMKINNLTKFMNAYRAKDGRPNTSWEDLFVAEQAKAKFEGNAIKQDDFSSMLTEIKQWASRDQKDIVFQPSEEDKLVTVQPFTKVYKNPSLFNPIEIYAYYLGLYINNRLAERGIFLKYNMSYPAKFDKKVIEGIQSSFFNGLKKSIPSSIWTNPKNKLNVAMNVTEPEAYAACALRVFGFEPEEDKPVNFAIYDFGGGTSDFAYGHYCKKNEQYKIETLGVDGINCLGGENILSGLAFEVFKENQDIMLKERCCFTRGIDQQSHEAVNEICISEQQPAKCNMRIMIEKLRPYWEEEEKYFSTYIDDKNKTYSSQEIIDKANDIIEKIQYSNLPEVTQKLNDIISRVTKDKTDTITPSVELRYIISEYKDSIEGLDEANEDEIIFDFTDNQFYRERSSDEDTSLQVGLKLHYSKKMIYEYISKRISVGVNSFITQLKRIFFKENSESENSKRVNILLAGNSSKSPILRKILSDKISNLQEELKKQEIETSIKIFSPLGSDNIWTEIEGLLKDQHIDDETIQWKIDMEKTKEYRPTGKTGVAYGLLELAHDEIKLESKYKEGEVFPYYLGLPTTKFGVTLFTPINLEGSTTRSRPNIGEWYSIKEITDDNVSNYRLLYTEDSSCIGDKMLPFGPGMERKELEIVSPKIGQHIFICAGEGGTISYVNASNVEEARSAVDRIKTVTLTI